MLDPTRHVVRTLNIIEGPSKNAILKFIDSTSVFDKNGHMIKLLDFKKSFELS